MNHPPATRIVIVLEAGQVREILTDAPAGSVVVEVLDVHGNAEAYRRAAEVMRFVHVTQEPPV